MIPGGVRGRRRVGENRVRAWLPCTLHPAMACAEEPVPYLQGSCFFLVLVLRNKPRNLVSSMRTIIVAGL